MIGKPMTGGKPWLHILKFTIPVLAGSLLQQLYQTADTVIVGNFTGERALAAVGTTNTLCFLLLAIAIGFSAGNGVISAQHFGAGKLNEVRKDGATGILFLGGVGIFFAIIAIAFSRMAYQYMVDVPENILLSGYDNTDISAMSNPSLTSVHIPLEEICLTALNMLWAMMQGESVSPVTFHTDLEIRTSTLPPK